MERRLLTEEFNCHWSTSHQCSHSQASHKELHWYYMQQGISLISVQWLWIYCYISVTTSILWPFGSNPEFFWLTCQSVGWCIRVTRGFNLWNSQHPHLPQQFSGWGHINNFPGHPHLTIWDVVNTVTAQMKDHLQQRVWLGDRVKLCWSSDKGMLLLWAVCCLASYIPAQEFTGWYIN